MLIFNILETKENGLAPLSIISSEDTIRAFDAAFFVTDWHISREYSKFFSTENYDTYGSYYDHSLFVHFVHLWSEFRDKRV